MVGDRLHFPYIVKYAVRDNIGVFGLKGGVFTCFWVAEVADSWFGVTFINFAGLTIMKHAY